MGGIFVVRQQAQLAVPKEEVTPRTVRITNVSDTQFAVSWVTTAATTGKVFYGKAGESLTSEVKDDRDQLSDDEGVYITHHVTVKGLQPGTKYAFRVASGSSKALFDNQGSPYPVSTGATLTTTPPAETAYGTVMQASSLPAEGSLVYLSIPGAAPMSTLVTTSGNWTIPLSIARSTDLSSYVKYDPSATVLTIDVVGGKGQSSQVLVTTENASPVPKIVLGQNQDLRTTTAKAPEEPSPSLEPSVTPTPSSGSGNLAEVPQTPGQFNVEPLDDNEFVDNTDLAVLLLNPAKEGETIATERPEFRGTGPKNTVLAITVESPKVYSDNVSIDDEGTWSWTPPADLTPGEHTVTIAYLDEMGEEKTISRTFLVDNSGLPAFESTPSASVKPSPSPSLNASSSGSVSASPRVGMPSTTSGVPVSGLLGPTWLTVLLGFAIIFSGALLLVL